MVRVHAICIHHRGREMLGECLASLLDSRDVELEIVVVANGCDEELPEIVENSPSIHLVTPDQSTGFSAANNLGVAWARKALEDPDYYYFVNNDTVSMPESLALLVRALDETPGGGIAGPRLLIQWAPEHLNSLGLNVTEDGWGWDEGIGIHQDNYGPLPQRRSVAAVTGSALLIDAGLYRDIDGWTELYDYYFEDIDLCLKARAANREVIIEPGAVVLHQVSATMTLDSEHKYFLFWRNRLLLTLVHWPLGLLTKVLKKVVIDEILAKPLSESKLQRRAFRGALGKLPRSLALRWGRGSVTRSWLNQLQPVGSVPVITLPDRAEIEAAAIEEPPESVTEPLESVPPATWSSAAKLTRKSENGKRILVLGWSPLPFENARMNYAPGVRTWQLAMPLAQDGHQVCIACARIPGAHDEAGESVIELERDGIVIYTMPRELFEDDDALLGLVERFQPDALVGASAVPSLRAVELAGDHPVWVDLFGDPMAEGQAKAKTDPTVDALPAYRDLLASLLDRGDAFSAVSDRQRWAAVGQLGLAGRLNRFTAGHELVHTVPCSITETPEEKSFETQAIAGLEPGDFVVLWSGGYNTWCDAETLFEALEIAMAADDRIRFISTGGGITGHDEETYARVQELVGQARHPQRYLLKGCLPAEEARQVQARADIGVVTEHPIYERSLGSSGRILGWLGTGLPFICTEISELGELAAQVGFGLTYNPGDTTQLARLIVEVAANPAKLRELSTRAHKYADEHLRAERTTQPLRRWARDAQRAHDHKEPNPISLSNFTKLRGHIAQLGEEVAHGQRVAAELSDQLLSAREFEAKYHQVRSELGKIHTSAMWRLWMKYFALRRIVSWPLRWLRPRRQQAQPQGDDQARGTKNGDREQ